MSIDMRAKSMKLEYVSKMLAVIFLIFGVRSEMGIKRFTKSGNHEGHGFLCLENGNQPGFLHVSYSLVDN